MKWEDKNWTHKEKIETKQQEGIKSNQLPLERSQAPPQPKTPSKRKLGNKKAQNQEKLQHQIKEENLEQNAT